MSLSKKIQLKLLQVFLTLTVFEGVFVLINIASIEPDPKNAWLFGYSKLRMLQMVIVLVGILLLGVFLWATISKPAFLKPYYDRIIVDNKFVNRSLWVTGVIFFAGIVFSFIPAYRFEDWAAHFQRLHPIIVWVMLISGQYLFWLLAITKLQSDKNWKERIQENQSLLFATGVSLVCTVIIWAGIYLTKAGLKGDSQTWNQAGTPILGLQLLIAWMIAFLFFFVMRSKKDARRVDVLVSLLIFLLAIIIWKNTPFPGDYFTYAPHQPNYEYYPHSDARNFDLSAQFALIGQKYSNGKLTSRPLLTFFLTAIYAIFGNDLDNVIWAQMILVALIPIVLYHFGKLYAARPAGLLAAILYIFVQSNAILSSRQVQRTNVRLIMTELPAALLIIFITWLIFWWWQQPEKRWGAIVGAGGLLGLSTLVRQNTWALLPAILFFITVILWKKWSYLWKYVVWFILGLFMAVSPWMARYAQFSGNPIYILDGFKYVVWNHRLSELVETPPTLTSSADQDPSMDPDNTLITPIISETAAPSLDSTEIIENKQLAAGGTTQYFGGAWRLISTVGNHFVHNYVASAVVFPPDFQFHDLKHTISAPDSYWQMGWAGQIDFKKAFLLVINLVIVSFGLGAAWKAHKLVGLFPLWIFFSYNAGSAIARTSGGRYLVPIEWVLPLYFALGVWTITSSGLKLFGGRQAVVQRFKNAPNEPLFRRHWLYPVMVAAGILVFAAILTTADSFFPEKYPSLNSQALLEQALETPQIRNLDGIERFLESEQAIIMEGTSLYPIFLYYGEKEDALPSSVPQGIYPLFTSTMIGPYGKRTIVLPIDSAPKISNGSEIIVLGCLQKNYVDTYAIIEKQENDQTAVYIRQPETEMKCPLPEPVCDENHQCK